MLHPEYNLDVMPKTMVRKNQNEETVSKSQKIILKTSKFPTHKIRVNTPNTLNVKSRTLKYPFLGSMRNDAPYKDPEKRGNEEFKESKKLWMTQKNIQPTPSVAREFSCVKAAFEAPYRSPSAHQFRSQSKEKWLGNTFKVA